ncbi:excalibur calcium-binding domain-containing protein [Actinomyces graevenitzii]|uniref:excalibur calcium-binding domain-containing protein n=1 Tax=Actinomyces graevenitzii TaxID=55565 RepID=UPI0009D9E93F
MLTVGACTITPTPTPTPTPESEAAPAPAPAPESESQSEENGEAAEAPADDSSSVYYSNCTEAWNAGAAPIYRGEPGYRSKLDHDNDGVACERQPPHSR